MWFDLHVVAVVVFVVCVDVFGEVLTAAHCTYDRKKSRIKVIEFIHSYKVI